MLCAAQACACVLDGAWEIKHRILCWAAWWGVGLWCWVIPTSPFLSHVSQESTRRDGGESQTLPLGACVSETSLS